MSDYKVCETCGHEWPEESFIEGEVAFGSSWREYRDCDSCREEKKRLAEEARIEAQHCKGPSLDGRCNLPTVANGLCRTHYNQDHEGKGLHPFLPRRTREQVAAARATAAEELLRSLGYTVTPPVETEAP